MCFPHYTIKNVRLMPDTKCHALSDKRRVTLKLFLFVLLKKFSDKMK